MITKLSPKQRVALKWWSSPKYKDYDAIITELMTSDETAAMNFVNALLPAGLVNAVPAKTN